MKSARSDIGNLRNFKAMGYWKLYGLFNMVSREANDPEALEAIRFELLIRGEMNDDNKRSNEALKNL